MIEAVDADVAGVLAGARQCAAEVAENCGALMLIILAAQLHFRSQEGVAAAGIDDVPRLQPVAALAGAHLEMSFARTGLFGRDDLMSLARIRAALARVLEEHLVEILPPDLIRMRRAVADRPAECVSVVAALIVGFKIGARLENAERPHLVQYTQPIEHRKVHRQQGFADVESRMMRFLQGNDLVAEPRQQCRRGAARGTAANHGHIAGFGRRLH